MAPQVKVSIILPAFNGERFIGQTVRSVIGQTFKDWELIVIDDCSTDRTIEQLKAFDDERIRLVSLEANRGPAAAKNIGLKAARGEWAAFLDSDDVWHPEMLQKLLDVALNHPGAFVASDILICYSSKDHGIIPWKRVRKGTQKRSGLTIFPTTLDFLKNGFDVQPLCPLRTIRDHGIVFPEQFRSFEKLEFMLSLYRYGLQLVVLNEPLYYYRIRPESNSSQYASILHGITSMSRLQSMDWLPAATKRVIHTKIQQARCRLLTSALRNRRWNIAFYHAVHYPASLLYLMTQLPRILWEMLHGRRVINS